MSEANPPGPKPIILVVEDQPDERFLAATLLEETGFTVIEAETAERALAILQERGDEVSVVFSDVRTPGPIGGFELARIIGVTWPRVRVLLTSGDAGDQPSDLRVSATFIPKPWRAGGHPRLGRPGCRQARGISDRARNPRSRRKINATPNGSLSDRPR